jgi:hypothetical protein
MKFIETIDGFINLDHVSRVVYDEQRKANFAIHADGETRLLVDWYDSEPLALMDFVTAPDGYRIAHINFRDGVNDLPFLSQVIGLYVSRLGDGGVRAVLEDDGTVSRLSVDTRLGYAALLVMPDGRLSDGECYTFRDLHAAKTELHAMRANKKEAA